MRNVFITLLCFGALASCTKPQEKAAEPVAEPGPPPQSEFADSKYVEMGKKGIDQLASGDIAGWMDAFADNAVYAWSSGDSLTGKQAISDYWTNRRTKVIDSLTFTNDIWLPIKVNRPQKGPDRVGVWLLCWYQVGVKYKNGKKLGMWIHTDMHFNNNDKIDRLINYLDSGPIKAALGTK
jgi:hypothetical protein